MSWTWKHKEAEGEAQKTQGDGLYRMRIYFHSQSPVAVAHRKPHQRHLAVGKQADRVCQRKVKNSQRAAAFAESHRIYQTTFHFADTETQPGLKEGKNPQTARDCSLKSLFSVFQLNNVKCFHTILSCRLGLWAQSSCLGFIWHPPIACSTASTMQQQ